MRAPADINGDCPMTSHEREAYLAYHSARNAERRAASASIRTIQGPFASNSAHPGSSPARAATVHFLSFACQRLREQFSDRDITVIDLGCGRGTTLDQFLEAGLRGRYIGIDVQRHPRWSDQPIGGFSRELVLGDVHTLDVGRLPMADVVVSCTALEHIRDDAGAIQRLKSRTREDGVHVHVVPGEASLPLYTTHGWRQYSPADLAGLFPGALIARYGGFASKVLHLRAITNPAARNQPYYGQRHPLLYAFLRRAAMRVDRWLGDRDPAIYGVLWALPACGTPAVRDAA